VNTPHVTEAPATDSHATEEELRRVSDGTHHNPHAVLGAHPSGDRVVVRARRPDASSIMVKSRGKLVGELQLRVGDIYEGTVPSSGLERGPDGFRYTLVVTYPNNERFEIHDPYAFTPTLGELDLHLFQEGTHLRLFDKLGAHVMTRDGVRGTAFAVWAPNARAARVVGSFNSWDGRLHPMRTMGASGVWELFVPGVQKGELYKFEIVGADGSLVLKTDPFASRCQHPPENAAIVDEPGHRFRDSAWMRARTEKSAHTAPMSIYEVHLGSWRRTPDAQVLSYADLARELAAYCNEMGFTHVELLPVAEHPFTGSWGYQVTNYFAPTSRFGTPDDFRAFVDTLHQAGVGVLVDWVPAHFPKDAWALGRYDGSALFEHLDPRQGEHPDWGTFIFNYGRAEVRNFLISNALYWFESFHIDGLRVDAVASMLYLDYSRKEGEWLPNRYGGRENLEAISFMRELNTVVHREHPGALMIAEESTAWGGVSRPVETGGLGFGFKWNMGWMHDTLEYMKKEPVHRRHHHNQLTFGLLYAFTENFVLSISHDEVVHGKGSLAHKMPGDRWQQLANLRVLFGHMWAHPGKKLLFMGSEFAQSQEWKFDQSLDWHLLEHPEHLGVQALVRDLNRVYRQEPALWQRDFSADGFRWLSSDDADQNVLSYVRTGDDGSRPVVCVMNFSPEVRRGYRVGAPVAGRYEELLNTDAAIYGGTNVGNAGEVHSEPVPAHGLDQSLVLTVPPLAAIWLAPRGL
jgi:1,4-alpha-glucan branching enzyme